MVVVKMRVDLLAIILVLISTIFAAFGSLFLKKASTKFKFSFKGIFNKNLILGGLIYVFSTIFFIAALRRGQVSILYPITSLSYIWVSIIAVLFLKEKMNKFRYIGILFIILGVILITI
jgi:uncharacterized membrane protein